MTKFIDEIPGVMSGMPTKSGLMQYVRRHYREISLMKGAGLTSRQIVDRLNEMVARGNVQELRKPVSVGYFNKTWHEFCQRNAITTKTSLEFIRQIEKEIFEYRDHVNQSVITPPKNEKTASPAQETALQLAELIKFLLEFLRQGSSNTLGSTGSQEGGVSSREELEMASRPKASKPVSPDIETLDKGKLASFFADE